MGVSCHIYIRKPADGVFRPGMVVSGAVKYAVDEDTYYADIVVGLRGKGTVRWTEGSGDSKRTYHGSEDYVKHTKSLLGKKANDDEEVLIQTGSYSHQFYFVFPSDIPSSYKDYNATIQYYVKMKFVRKGLFHFNKRFRSEVIFKNGYVNSELPDEPIIYGAEKSLMTLTGLFSSDKDVIRMKVTVKKSKLTPGEKAELEVEVHNDSGTEISTVETQLMKKAVYKSNSGRTHNRQFEVETAKSGTEAVEEKSTANFTNLIRIPDTDFTMQCTNILELNYVLVVKAKIPFPHLNLNLEIPIIIREVGGEIAEGVQHEGHFEHEPIPDDPPPSYWEAMSEDKMVEGKKEGHKGKT